MTKKQIAQSLRNAADKIEAGGDWSDEDYLQLAEAARNANRFQVERQAANDSGLMSRAAWDALPPAEQSHFIKNGGRLVDLSNEGEGI